MAVAHIVWETWIPFQQVEGRFPMTGVGGLVRYPMALGEVLSPQAAQLHLSYLYMYMHTCVLYMYFK